MFITGPSHLMLLRSWEEVHMKKVKVWKNAHKARFVLKLFL